MSQHASAPGSPLAELSGYLDQEDPGLGRDDSAASTVGQTGSPSKHAVHFTNEFPPIQFSGDSDASGDEVPNALFVEPVFGDPDGTHTLEPSGLTIADPHDDPPSPDCAGPPLLLEETPDRQASLLLRDLWSTEGHHQLAVMDPHTQRFRSLPVTSLEQALHQGLILSSKGQNVFFAPAAYESPENRTSTNVIGAYSLWVDLDCGTEKAAKDRGYADKNQARDAVAAFCEATGLPRPTHVVDSGGGLHLYWRVNSLIHRDAWQQHARMFKAIAEKFGFLADPSRTADAASILRLPGTLNYKYSPPLPVRLEFAAERALDRDELLRLIAEVFNRLCGSAKSPGLPTGEMKRCQAQATTDHAGEGPPDLTIIASALFRLTPDCEEIVWKLRRLAPLALLATQYPRLADDLRALAKAWSSGELGGVPSVAWVTRSKASGTTGAEAFDQAWERFLSTPYSGEAATYRTIYYDAQDAGWVFPSLKAAPQSASPSSASAPSDTSTEDPLETMLGRVKAGDVGAPFEKDSIAALVRLRQKDQAEFQRVRSRLKAQGIALGALDAAIKEAAAERTLAPTHHGYALGIVQLLTHGGHAPVAFEGCMYAVDVETQIWIAVESKQVERLVAENYDGRDNCKRRTDYAGIAEHAKSLVSSEAFFDKAPIGVATPEGFYRIEGNLTVIEPVTAALRQRVLLDITPRAMPTPQFDKFLHETFKSETEGEEAQQIALVQEIAGSVMLGLMHRHHVVALFYDAFGRSGKGTLEGILGCLVPRQFVTAVSPFDWDREYFVVQLAGSRLNIVGELPDNKSIPAAIFKSVIGGDLITGRNPAHRPIVFRNGAAHILTSNHLITSRDHSEAFFARWLIVDFPNSRLKSGLPLDPQLGQRIASQELPGIAYWALAGATRLLQNNRFSRTAAHDRLMAKWRRSNSSLEEFIHEECERDAGYTAARAEFYSRYKTWCKENGRTPFSKSGVKELLEHNVGLGITWAVLNGYEIFRGVQLKPAEQVDYGGNLQQLH